MAGRVFISYRRSETAWAARAVFERLWREFPQRVFIDLETIALGADFTRELGPPPGTLRSHAGPAGAALDRRIERPREA